MTQTKIMRKLIAICLIAMIAMACEEIDEEIIEFDDEIRMDGLTEQLPSDPNMVSMLGQGRDSLTEEWKNRCVVNSDPIYSSANNESRFIFDRTMSESELEDSFGFSVSAKAAYGMFSGSARASFSKATKTHSRSINMVYKASVVTGTLILDQWNAKWKIKKKDPSFYSQCGDTFVQQIKQGGEIYILLRIDFATESEKMAFEAAVSASYGTTKVKANLEKARRSFAGRATVHVEAYQFGGETYRLGNALGPKTAITCSMDRFEECESLMENALAYAAGKGTNAFPQNLRRSPANLNYVIRDWAMLGAGAAAQDVVPAIADAREALLEKLNLQVDIQNRYAALEAASYFGAPSSFRDRVQEYNSDSVKNVRILKKAATACYDNFNPKSFWSVVDCINGAKDENLQSSGYRNLSHALDKMDVPLRVYTLKGRKDVVKTISPGVGFWGDWSEFKMCPAGQFATGYRMRVEGRQKGSGDDTALNAVELECFTWDGDKGPKIKPHPGFWGQWQPWAHCTRGPINGMRIDIESRQRGGDDTGANNLKASCVSGKEIQAAGSAPWGDEGEMKYCPAGTAVCGVRVRVEDEQGKGDDTAMNGIDLACCEF